MKAFLISLGVILFCGWFAVVEICNIQPLVAGVLGTIPGAMVAVGIQI